MIGQASVEELNEFNYGNYSAKQVRKIADCIADIKDDRTGKVECPQGEGRSTSSDWEKWAWDNMTANRNDGAIGSMHTTDGKEIDFRLIGIKQDDRADGKGKAGLTFQATGVYAEAKMNNMTGVDDVKCEGYYCGGWRDSRLRHDMNASDGSIWSVMPDDFKKNVAPVNKIADNGHIDSWKFIRAVSATIDKLWILSQPEMGMPMIGNGKKDSSYNINITNTDNKFTAYGKWFFNKHALYDGMPYQWWMFGSPTSTNPKRTHNSNITAYCTLLYPTAVHKHVPSEEDSSVTNTFYPYCRMYNSFWLRSVYAYQSYTTMFYGGGGQIIALLLNDTPGVIPAFAF